MISVRAYAPAKVVHSPDQESDARYVRYGDVYCQIDIAEDYMEFEVDELDFMVFKESLVAACAKRNIRDILAIPELFEGLPFVEFILASGSDVVFDSEACERIARDFESPVHVFSYIGMTLNHMGNGSEFAAIYARFGSAFMLAGSAGLVRLTAGDNGA